MDNFFASFGCESPNLENYQNQ